MDKAGTLREAEKGSASGRLWRDLISWFIEASPGVLSSHDPSTKNDVCLHGDVENGTDLRWPSLLHISQPMDLAPRLAQKGCLGLEPTGSHWGSICVWFPFVRVSFLAGVLNGGQKTGTPWNPPPNVFGSNLPKKAPIKNQRAFRRGL